MLKAPALWVFTSTWRDLFGQAAVGVWAPSSPAQTSLSQLVYTLSFGLALPSGVLLNQH